MLFIYIFFVCVFFFLKKTVQSTFKMEEIYHFVSQQLDDERKRRVAALQILTIAENSNADLKQKLKDKEQAKKSSDSALKSAESALQGAETQAESQRKLANEVKGQLVTAKEQMAALKQQLKEANKLKDLAKKAKL